MTSLSTVSLLILIPKVHINVINSLSLTFFKISTLVEMSFLWTV